MIYQDLLNHVPNIPTTDMTYDDWLEKRKGSIGGSDAGAIMGYVGEWGSPLTVFLYKKGIAKSKELSPAAKRGKILEPVIREYFATEYPSLFIEKVPYMLYHPDYPFISANIDGIIFADEPTIIDGKQISGIGGLEIKSTKNGYGYSENEIPDGHYCQVQHYMSVTGLAWFVLAAYFLDKEEVRYYVIMRDDSFIEKDLIPAEKAFWNNHVLTDIWPAAIGIDEEESMLSDIFEGGSTLVLGDEELSMCRQYVEAHKQYKEAEETKKRISTTLKEIIVQKQSGSGEKKISAITGSYSISWSKFETSRVDTDLLKKSGMYERFVKKSESGKFLITEKKGA
jgi:putative phage-type endonuclease